MSRLSAIKFAHAVRDLPDPTTNARILAVWEASAAHPPPEQVAPSCQPCYSTSSTTRNNQESSTRLHPRDRPHARTVVLRQYIFRQSRMSTGKTVNTKFADSRRVPPSRNPIAGPNL